ncbi:solute carrier family 1 member 7b isoform X5 [Phycodurus eques]|uniref:solute carrier family 1 member 7b isoform X5 n=1 Tax=Phycodurus eques TaxID=693459 RepID=UPI002ACEB742|nr:solute carrier family 1 member 7b isoform X5 [Phycodurus eques]
MAVALEAVWLRVKNVCKQNGLLIMSVLAVVIGCLLGFFLRTRRLSEQEVKYFQFPGELLMRMLKMLILPLVVSSLMSGLAALDAKCSSRLGLITVSYYLWTTFVAVVVGIFMVSIIHPGGAAQKEDSEDSAKPIMSSADALLDLIRNMFPANLVQATFQQATATVRVALCFASVSDQQRVHPTDRGHAGARHAATAHLRHPGRQRERRPQLLTRPDSASERARKNQGGNQRRHERPRHRHFFSHHGYHAGQDGSKRERPGQLLPEFERGCAQNCRHCYLVLSVRDRVPGGGQDPGNERPVGHGQEVGLLRRHGCLRPGAPRPLHPARHVLLHHQEESHRLHPRNPPGAAHRPGHLVQLGHAAYHLQVPPGEQPHRPAHHPLRAARGRHHQHGRDRALRGRGRHLHRAGQQLRAGLRTDHHHQHHGHGRQHRRSGHPPSGPGYHGDRADLRGPADRRHQPDHRRGLGARPLPHHGQRHGRRPGHRNHGAHLQEGLHQGGRRGAAHLREPPRRRRGASARELSQHQRQLSPAVHARGGPARRGAPHAVGGGRAAAARHEEAPCPPATPKEEQRPLRGGHERSGDQRVTSATRRVGTSAAPPSLFPFPSREVQKNTCCSPGGPEPEAEPDYCCCCCEDGACGSMRDKVTCLILP